jgi:hypothetical protein
MSCPRQGRVEWCNARRVLFYKRKKRLGDNVRLRQLEQEAQPLGPGQRRLGRFVNKTPGVEDFSEIYEHGGDVVQSAGVFGIAHELERRRLGRRHIHWSPGSVHRDGRHALEIFANVEINTNLAAFDWRPRPTDHDLKSLGSVVRGSVELGRTEQPHVVGITVFFHELWDELFGGKATEHLVLRRNHHIEASLGGGQFSF